MTKDGNSEYEVKARISKARGAFAALRNIWKTNKISNRTKKILFKSTVLSVLLYSAESWKVTKGICQMLEVCKNKCLSRILRIYWPSKISNKGLHERTGIQPISVKVKRCRWRWIGYVCRMPLLSISRVAMHWTPGGKRARGDQTRHGEDQWSGKNSDGVEGQVTKLAVQCAENIGVLWLRPYVLSHMKINLTNIYIMVVLWKLVFHYPRMPLGTIKPPDFVTIQVTLL